MVGLTRRMAIVLGVLLVAAGTSAGPMAVPSEATRAVNGPPDPIVATPVADGTYQMNSRVLADYSCDSFQLYTCVGTVPDGSPIDTRFGQHTFRVIGTYFGIGQSITTHTYVATDLVDPTVTVRTPPNAAVYAQHQSVIADYSCADDYSLRTCVGTVDDGSPVDTATAGNKSFTVTATDWVGNTRTVTRSYRVTASAPAVELRTPADAGTYTQGSTVVSDYSCSPGPNGLTVTSCAGDIPNGQVLDTATLGQRTFAVTATDTAGASTTVTHTYSIVAAPVEPPSLALSWGALGSDTSHMNGPGGIAVGPDGSVYVADQNNRRIIKFSAAGHYLTAWGSLGSGPGQFNRPEGLAVDSQGNVYVADRNNARIQKFSPNGTFLASWGTSGSGNGQFNEPADVAVDSSGNVYVADAFNHRIQKFTGTGMFVAKWGSLGGANGQFNTPQGIEVDAAGQVFVADSGNGRIEVFDGTGTYLTKFGGPGSGNGQFSQPRQLTFSETGLLLVADTGNDRVQEMSPAGTFVTAWGNHGSGDGQFDSPFGVAAGFESRVYVADTYNHRVQLFGSVPPPTGIAGAVTDAATAAPVAGSWIAVLRASDLSIAAGGVADTTGIFTMEVPAGDYYLYLVDPTGQHAAGFDGPPSPVTVVNGQVVITAPRMTSLRGTVTAHVTEVGSGTPIGGVWGLALSTARADTGATEQIVTANAATGDLSMAGLLPRSHYIGFVDPTGAHATRFHPNSPNVPQATPVAVTAGSATSADVVLPSQAAVGTGAAVSGTVTDAQTSAPIAGARVVALRAADFQMVRGAIADDAGRYSLDLAAGDYKLAFLDSQGLHAMEWYDNRPSTGLADAATVTAPNLASAALTPTTGTLSGTVTASSTGAVLEGAWVIAIGPQGIAGGAVTGGDGTYRITGLPPGTYRLTFADPNGGRTQEYWDNSPSFTGSTAFSVVAGTTTTKDAALT